MDQLHKSPLLSAPHLLELMENKRYGVEFQPIICTSRNEIFAYESLSRFFSATGESIRPDLVYASLHHHPLSFFQVEYEQKKIQLANAPDNTDIFVNLDQDSYSASGAFDNKNPFIQLFMQHKKSKIVVELIENAKLSDAMMSLSMIDNLAKNNISTAIDDLFDPQSILSTSVIQLVDHFKLDKFVLKNRHDNNFMAMVSALINYAHGTGKKVILEGVETQDDLAFAKKINADFVQGFLYKPLFERIL